MRRIGIGLAAVLALGVMVPAAVMSAPKAPAGLDAKALERGKTEAPALITAAGMKCSVSNALWIGGTEDKKTKSKIDYYEVACSDNVGFVVMSDTTKPTPTAYTCFETNKLGADGKPGQLACKLPENADQNAKLAPYLAKAGNSCVLDKVRSIGASPTQTFFEVSCQGGGGYVMIAAAPMDASKDVAMNSCLLYDENSNVKCEMTNRTEIINAAVTKLAAESGKNCAVTDKRYILTSKENADYFEVACQDGKGYVLERTAAGKLGRTIACADAGFVNGGCTLTDARAAQTEQNDLYTKVATKAGYNCQVTKYGVFNAPPGKEVVELQCSNRPDGAIMVTSAGTTKVFNCAQSVAEGFACSYSKPETGYAALTAMIKGYKNGTFSCDVIKTSATTSASSNYVEVACGGGNGRLVMEFAKGDPNLKSIINCAEFGACKLPAK